MCSLEQTSRQFTQYTYSWSVNGVEVKSQTLYEGDNVSVPFYF